MNNNSGGGRFFDGFLFGLIIGGGLVFLLGTKKGKRLLKMISEEGIENISELLEKNIDQEEYEEKPDEEITLADESISNGEAQNLEESKKSNPLRRRFFRRR